VAVHGGFLPGKTPREQAADRKIRSTIVRVRWLTPEGEHWAELWDQHFNVVYGHEAHSLSRPYDVQAPSGARTVGIDTGCVHGGHLTAFVVENDGATHFVQVPAAKCYHRHHGLRARRSHRVGGGKGGTPTGVWGCGVDVGCRHHRLSSET